MKGEGLALQILSLESHLEKRRGTEAWDNCQEKVIGVAKRTLGEYIPPES